MRDTTQFFILLSLLGFVLMAGCSDYDKFEPYDSNDEHYVYLNSLKPKGTVANIDPANAHTVITSDSILLEIPANAFMDEYGRAYTEEVQLVFANLDEPYHLLAYGISLVQNNGQLINPLAVIRMDAFTASGHLLKLNYGKTLRVKYPGSLDIELPDVFITEEQSLETALNNWKVIHSEDFSNKVFKESWTWKSEDGEIRNSEGLILNTTKLDWIVLGYSLQQVTEMKLNVSLAGNFSEANTRVFLLGNENIYQEELLFDQERHTFCNQTGIVSDEDILTLVSLSKSYEQEVYIDITNIQVDSDSEELLNPKLKSIAEVLQMLVDL